MTPRTDAMRPGLRRALVVSVLLSAAAILWPMDAVKVVAQVTERAAPRAEVLAPVEVPPTAVAADAQVALPAQMPRHVLGGADFDPFTGVQPAPPPSPPPERPFVGPVQAPPPQPPQLNYRYLGQFTDPGGKRTVYLATAGRDLSVAVGSALDEGYVVESISPSVVRLYYPPLRAHLDIPIPANASGNPSLALNSSP